MSYRTYLLVSIPNNDFWIFNKPDIKDESRRSRTLTFCSIDENGKKRDILWSVQNTTDTKI